MPQKKYKQIWLIKNKFCCIKGHYQVREKIVYRGGEIFAIYKSEKGLIFRI